MLNILIIEDQFLTKDIFKREFNKTIDEKVQYSVVSSNWPSEPFVEDDEIKEYFPNIAEKVLRNISDKDIVVTQGGPINKEILDKAKQLKIIGVARGGPVNINLEEATRKGIAVVNAPGRNDEAVAEFTLGLMLAEVRDIARSHADLKLEKRWRGDLYKLDEAGFELPGHIAGVIGFGHIGKRVTEILRAFGMRINVYDPYTEKSQIENKGANKVDNLLLLLRQADLVTLHARYTKETHNMIGGEEFNAMKGSAYFVNTARGGLVDHEALYNSLQRKKIAGAALDTFDFEPIPDDSPLYDLDNVTITSHIAGATKQTAYRSVKLVTKEIGNFLLDRPLQNCLNPEIL